MFTLVPTLPIIVMHGKALIASDWADTLRFCSFSVAKPVSAGVLLDGAMRRTIRTPNTTLRRGRARECGTNHADESGHLATLARIVESVPSYTPGSGRSWLSFSSVGQIHA